MTEYEKLVLDVIIAKLGCIQFSIDLVREADPDLYDLAILVIEKKINEIETLVLTLGEE